MDMAALIQQMLAQQNKQPVTTGNNPFSRGFLGRAIGNLFNPQPDALPPAAAHVMAANQPDPYSPAPSQGGFDMSNAPMPTPRPADLGAPPDSAMQASTAPNPMMPAPTPTQDPLQAAAKDALAMPQAGGDVPNNLAFSMPGMDQKATGGLGPEMMNGKGDFGMVPPDPSAGGGFGGLFASLFGGGSA